MRHTGLSPGNPLNPTTAPMLTIDPPDPMCGRHARTQCSGPDRLVAMTASQSARSSRSILPPRCRPALLTSTSIPPQACATDFAIRAISAGSVTSPRNASALRAELGLQSVAVAVARHDGDAVSLGKREPRDRQADAA